jgi:hypothetical protein
VVDRRKGASVILARRWMIGAPITNTASDAMTTVPQKLMPGTRVVTSATAAAVWIHPRAHGRAKVWEEGAGKALALETRWVAVAVPYGAASALFERLPSALAVQSIPTSRCAHRT